MSKPQGSVQYLQYATKYYSLFQYINQAGICQAGRASLDPAALNIYWGQCQICGFTLHKLSYLNCRAGEGISEPLSEILYNMSSDELFKHPATQIESLVLSCR